MNECSSPVTSPYYPCFSRPSGQRNLISLCVVTKRGQRPRTGQNLQWEIDRESRKHYS